MFRPVFFASSPKPKIGEIVAYGGATVPTGWKECNGDSLERAAYTELFAVIGGSWGTADSTHFNIPDLRGRIPRGWDNDATRDPNHGTRTACNTGGVTGNKVGTVQDEAFKAHSHDVMTYHGGLNATSGSDNTVQEVHAAYNVPSGSTGGNETRPINAYVMFIIKATA